MSALLRNKWYKATVWIYTGNPSIWEIEAAGTWSQCCLHSQSEVKVCLGYKKLQLKQTKIAAKECDLTAQWESLIKRLLTIHVVSPDFHELGSLLSHFFYVFTLCFWRAHIATVHRRLPTSNKEQHFQIKKGLPWGHCLRVLSFLVKKP